MGDSPYYSLNLHDSPPLILEGDSNGKGIGLMADVDQRETTSVTLYGLIFIASNEDGDGNV